MIGGSLGHGLGQAVGMALGQRLDGGDARVFCRVLRRRVAGGLDLGGDDVGRRSFGSTTSSRLIDCNGIQADGAIVIDIEPVAEKCRAFGWETSEIDGNAMDDDRRGADRRAQPRTASRRRSCCAPRRDAACRPSRQREKAHFVRVDPHEWDG